MADKEWTLSAVEYEICRLLADGLTNGQIAQQKSVSEYTVRSHVANIYRKLRVHNRVSAARWFWRGRVQTMAPDTSAGEEA